MKRRQGFTLIELLVVIAIIGILAAMVFPVFARARESARRVVCLSNVKNIALAFQMYLGDYDRFPPGLTSSAYDSVYDLLLQANEGRSDMCLDTARTSNPYLRWPVILDEYVKNRDVWTCPNATFMEGFNVVFDPGGADGWAHWFATHPFTGWDGTYLYHPCMAYFPTGWGGEVTDSVTEWAEICYVGSEYKSAKGMYTGSIGTTEEVNYDLPMASVNDPANFVVAACSATNRIWRPTFITWEVCCNYYGGCGTDETNAAGWTIGPDDFKKFWTDASYRSSFTRHLGGSNIAFADGHAKWYNADAFLAEVPHQDCPDPENGGTGAWHEGTIQGCGSYNNVVACPTW